MKAQVRRAHREACKADGRRDAAACREWQAEETRLATLEHEAFAELWAIWMEDV